MKPLQSFQVFKEDNNIDVQGMYEFIIEKGAYGLYENMTYFSNFKHASVLIDYI